VRLLCRVAGWCASDFANDSQVLRFVNRVSGLGGVAVKVSRVLERAIPVLHRLSQGAGYTQSRGGNCAVRAKMRVGGVGWGPALRI